MERLAPDTYIRKLEQELDPRRSARARQGRHLSRQRSVAKQEAGAAARCPSGSLAGMLAQFASEEKELRLLQQHSRGAKPANSVTVHTGWQ